MSQVLRLMYPAPVGGLRKDRNPFECGMDELLDSTNYVLRLGRVKPRNGFASLGGDVGSGVRGCISYGASTGFSGVSGGDAIVAGCDNGWYKYNAGAWTGLTGALSASSHFTFRQWAYGATPYILGLNNGVDVPKKWDGAGAAIADIGGSPAKARAMMILANRLCLYNLTTRSGYTGILSPLGYDVSAFNDFESGWSGQVQQGRLADTPGDIIGALEMGELQGAIYKSDAIVMQIAQGGNDPFRFEWRPYNGAAGPCNNRCIWPLQDGTHAYLGTDGAVYRFDGTAPQSLGIHIQRAVQNYGGNNNTDFTGSAFGFYDPARNEIRMFFKSAGIGNAPEVTVCMSNLSVWHQDIGLSVPITAGGALFIPGSTSGSQVTLFTTVSGHAFYESGVFTDAGAVIGCQLYHAYSDMGTPDRWKTVQEIEPVLNYASGGTMSAIVWPGQSTSGAELATGPSQAVTIAQGVPAITGHRTTARWVSVQFFVASDRDWSYNGCRLEASLRGER